MQILSLSLMLEIHHHYMSELITFEYIGYYHALELPALFWFLPMIILNKSIGGMLDHTPGLAGKGFRFGIESFLLGTQANGVQAHLTTLAFFFGGWKCAANFRTI